MIKMKEMIIKSLTYLISLFIAILTPISGMLYLILFLVLADMITAIIADLKLKGNKLRNIKSRKLRRTIVKLLLYWLFIFISYIIPTICFDNHLYIVNIAVSMISIVEFKSITENSGIILGNDILINIFKNIRKKIENNINDKIEKPD